MDGHERIAILGVPARTNGDVDDIYSFLVEPSFRRDLTLLLGVDRSFDELDPVELTTPEMGYPWSLERLQYLMRTYARNQQSDGIPPLTPIEAILLGAMRSHGLTPQAQYGIIKYRVDFAFPAQHLVVECDGRGWHDAERDARRDAQLEALGWKTLRFTGSEIYRRASAVTKQIVSELETRSHVTTYTEQPREARRAWWHRILDFFLGRHQPQTSLPPPSTPASERSVPAWKAHLDADQRRAVDGHEGVIQVIAPAGSGKTTTMIARVQELFARGALANRILCTTFNRDTRVDLEARLEPKGLANVQVKTFHALGRAILDQEGLLRSEIGSISHGQWRRIAKLAKDAVEDGVWIDAPVAAEVVSNYKLSEMWDPLTARQRAANSFYRTAAEIYTLYEEHLEAAGRNDFDDLIFRAVEHLKSNDAARRRWQDRWEHVLVDEYQDIEPAQELLIRFVAAPEDSLFTVGDEDQCIYTWRRASVERIVMLDTKYPGLQRVVLSTSYRCPPVVTDAARSLISNNRRRFPKEILPSPNRKGLGEIELRITESLAAGAHETTTLLKEHDGPPGEIVVLARTSRLLRAVVRACAEQGVAVNAPRQSLRLTDSEKTVLAYLRVVSSPRSAQAEDIKRSFRVPNRYLRDGDQHRIRQALGDRLSFAGAVESIGATGSEEWRTRGQREWAQLCQELRTAADATAAMKLLRTSGGLDRHYMSVDQLSRHDQYEVEALEDIQDAATGRSLFELVTHLESRALLLNQDRNSQGGKDAIELNTIHRAKGREWDTVILFGADDDQLPHRRTVLEAESEEELEVAIEDERRLAYVAITRTRHKLVLVTTGVPSPYLREAGITQSAGALPTRASLLESRGSSHPSRDSASPTVQAQYRTICHNCGRPIEPGNPIRRFGDGWAHDQCDRHRPRLRHEAPF
ncbi:MAG: UvrD-helicase domain-containing protein [bacterium]|nr:UvrD-helicase domain-containing protein [bacterium]